jgi:hypothetical protein
MVSYQGHCLRCCTSLWLFNFMFAPSYISFVLNFWLPMVVALTACSESVCILQILLHNCNLQFKPNLGSVLQMVQFYYVAHEELWDINPLGQICVCFKSIVFTSWWPGCPHCLDQRCISHGIALVSTCC